MGRLDHLFKNELGEKYSRGNKSHVWFINVNIFPVSRANYSFILNVLYILILHKYLHVT